jgi:Domain of unknown function (DUF4189)
MFTVYRRSGKVLSLFCLALAVSAIVAFSRAQANPIGDRFAAIAYSGQTGRYGYAYGRTCLADAESAAVANCAACDARVVIRVENGWVALARGVNGTAYGVGWSTRSLADAEGIALQGCAQRGCLGYIAAWAQSRYG